MATFDKTIVIAAPLSKVFDYVSQPEHFPNLLPITDFQFLTHMHRGAGTRMRYNLDLGGKRMLTECSLTSLEVDQAVQFHYTKGMTCDWTVTSQEVEGGTQLRWKGDYVVPVGFLGKILGRTENMQKTVEATVDDGLRKLKETLESG